MTTINQNTLLLDQTTWDLVLDVNGNIALAGWPYSIAQDVASAVRTFLGECWFDTTQGIPYWQQTLGNYPPPSFVKQAIENAALTVPNVASVNVVLTQYNYATRQISGQIQIVDTSGNAGNVGFNW